MSVLQQASDARIAAIDLAAATSADKDAALRLMSKRLRERSDDIIAANAVDVAERACRRIAGGHDRSSDAHRAAGGRHG